MCFGIGFSDGVFAPALSDAKLLYSDKPTNSYAVNVLCIDGHKFVAANRVRWRSPKGFDRFAPGQIREWISDSIVQMYEERDGKALPAKC